MPFHRNKRAFYVSVFLIALGTILAVFGVLFEGSRYRPNMIMVSGLILGIIGLILLGFADFLETLP